VNERAIDHLAKLLARQRAVTGSWPRNFATAATHLKGQRGRAIQVWNIHNDYEPPHTAAGNEPLRLGAGVTKVVHSDNPGPSLGIPTVLFCDHLCWDDRFCFRQGGAPA
jgi:hypothetical protein